MAGGARLTWPFSPPPPSPAPLGLEEPLSPVWDASRRFPLTSIGVPQYCLVPTSDFLVIILSFLS